MSRFDDLVDGVLRYSRVVIGVMLVATLVMGAGASRVEESSSLEQFQSESKEARKLDYIQSNFSTRDENVSTVQIIVEGDDVLSKKSLLAMLRYQQRLRSNETINATLTDDRAVFSVANLVATAAIVREEGRQLRRLAAKLERQRAALAEQRAALQNRSDELNATADQLRAALTELRRNENASIKVAFGEVRANTSVELDRRDFGIFRKAARDLRNATTKAEVESAYTLGTKGVLKDEFKALQERSKILKAEAEDVKALGERVRRQQAVFENASDPSPERQRAKLRSMNQSQVESTVAAVLNASSNPQALSLMPTDYEPGSTDAKATMIIVRQRTTKQAAQSSATDRIIDSQLAMQQLDDSGGLKYAVFGAGIIAHEIDASMEDSIAIVAPLALLFVLLTLTVAYRDLLDILLGALGIGAVLAWTFGFMGYADIAFNQIFVAVPVLLIGLSIDYAIHIFMRHREERAELTADDGAADDGSRHSMTVALGGVGIALVWVTATTVIGFLSNLTSPVPPIREFGIVSAFGIMAALLVFGLLVPALKVELDELLEGFGVDRRKRAFGTGGGRLGNLLSVGATVARKAPLALILVALLVSGAGAVGGSQVETSFSQADFLAEDPPAWMDRLPEPMEPGDYRAKQNLKLVNGKFVREDSQAQILIEGDVTSPNALTRVARARESAGTKPVTQNLSNGQPAITGPLSTMRSVAAQNETFNATFQAADTNGDGVPDRNLKALYDQLFRVAPDQAAEVIYREDGEYRALRVVVSVEGGAEGDEVTAQMRDVADVVDGSGLTATATGSAILNEIVQDRLLETVVQSLAVTLVAVFLFLAAAYRLTDGSATLGLVTMTPVALTVAWILGTMFLLDIPFNVLTGMITSLTVGLGVAYSIHLSERYTQELARTSSVWDAMNRAVTGTGGALLGSAATTVGGFGVLVFAILPPLQQFGFITGITIIYAFLASVLVLPSLLVVWTRYVGPQWAREEVAAHGLSAVGRDDDDGPGPSSGDDDSADDPGSSPDRPDTVMDREGTDEVGPGPAPDGPPTDGPDADTQTAEPTPNREPDGHPAGGHPQPARGAESQSIQRHEQADAGGDSDPATDLAADHVAGGGAAVTAGGDGPSLAADREVSFESVMPGSYLEVTVTLSGLAGRTVLSEAFDGGVESVVGADPEPIQQAVRGNVLHAVWDHEGEATLSYRAAIPEDAGVDDDRVFVGRVTADGHTVAVEGVQHVTVAPTEFEWAGDFGRLSAADVAAAGARAERGEIPMERFEHLLSVWSRDGVMVSNHDRRRRDRRSETGSRRRE